MLLLNPQLVKFNGVPWDPVSLVAIDRAAEKLVVAWSDAGAHAVFVDVPEQRVSIRVVQDLSRDDPGSPRPGEEGEIEFFTSPTRSDAARRRIAATCVVTRVTHEVSPDRGSSRTIEMLAVSADGVEDPVEVAEV